MNLFALVYMLLMPRSGAGSALMMLSSVIEIGLYDAVLKNSLHLKKGFLYSKASKPKE